MRLSISLLLPALAGVAHAASASAKVYILQGSKQDSKAAVPTLTPEQTRLVLAQRLDVSQYHKITVGDEAALKYINEFGGQHQKLFASKVDDDRPYQLVVIVEGTTPETELSMMRNWDSPGPSFEISNIPSKSANEQLVQDIIVQGVKAPAIKCSLADAINPFEEECWTGRTKIMHFDLLLSETAVEEFADVKKDMIRFVQTNALEVMFVMIPESTQASKDTRKQYGIYDMPTESHVRRREHLEELLTGSLDPEVVSRPAPVSGFDDSKLPLNKTLPKVPPRCYGSVNACIASTNACSGHGSCYKRYNSTEAVCYACACESTTVKAGGHLGAGSRTVQWAGAACSKEDISGQFWLLVGFSVILVGLASWAIGMLVSIGEEKLPGVIGAGVSGTKAR